MISLACDVADVKHRDESQQPRLRHRTLYE